MVPQSKALAFQNKKERKKEKEGREERKKERKEENENTLFTSQPCTHIFIQGTNLPE